MITAIARAIAALLRVTADQLHPEPCPLCTKHWTALANDIALIDVRVAACGLPWLGDWTECEGLRLVEQDDGTYELQVTADLAKAQIADFDQRAGTEGIK